MCYEAKYRKAELPCKKCEDDPGSATQVKIAILKKDAEVHFSIEDNGKGFDVREVKARTWPQKGLGLIAMEERARILGGPFERTSRTGHGTRITLACPLPTDVDTDEDERPQRGHRMHGFNL